MIISLLVITAAVLVLLMTGCLCIIAEIAVGCWLLNDDNVRKLVEWLRL